MPTPDGFEGKSLDELEDSLATIQQQLNALTAEINKRKGVDNWNAANVPATSTDKMEYSGRLYMWGRERITQQDVLNVVNSIKEPYSSEISSYLKSNNIAWLQEYLNSKIDSWDIDASKLKAALTPKGIWLYANNHIKVDWKFWPQTLETLKFLVKESQDPSSSLGTWSWTETWSWTWWEEVYEVDEDKTEKFTSDKFNTLKRKASALLPNKVSIVYSQSPNPENPEFTLKIDDKYNWSVVKYVKLNFHDYINGDTFYDNKFKNEVRRIKEEWYEEITFQNWIEKNNKYTLEELFPGESSSIMLTEFFEKFWNSKLKISNASFDVDGDKLHFYFDKRFFDSAKWCYQEIDKKDLKWEDGKYSEEKFKDALRDIVRRVANEL